MLAAKRFALLLLAFTMVFASATTTAQRRAPPTPPTNSCADLRARFTAVVNAPDLRCSTNADCRCYPNDVETFCYNRPMNTTTQRQLEQLRQRWLERGCPDRADLCSPYGCHAACDNGICRDRYAGNSR